MSSSQLLLHRVVVENCMLLNPIYIYIYAAKLLIFPIGIVTANV